MSCQSSVLLTTSEMFITRKSTTGRSQGRGLSRQDITTTVTRLRYRWKHSSLTIEDYAHVIDWPRRRR
jgi:hypothetical protein